MVISNEMRIGGLGVFLLGALAIAACSSSSGTTTTGGGGTSASSATSNASTTSSGTGGTVSGTTSSTGSTTSTGSTSSSSSGATTGCAMSDAPPSANILMAGNDGGLSLTGGITTYGTKAPTASTNGSGALLVSENDPASATAAEYDGAVLYFSGNTTGTDCVNGSTYTGVEFTISGTVTGCAVVFTINDSEHSAVSVSDPKASGPAGSYPGTVPVTVTSTATQTKVPFLGTGAPSGGMPATAIDPTKLESISWQYVIQPGTTTCTSSLTIDDIAFY
jgi:hypothetical protein